MSSKHTNVGWYKGVVWLRDATPSVALVAIGAAALLSTATPANAQLVFVPSGTLTADGTVDYSTSIILVGENSTGYGVPVGYGYVYSAPGPSDPYEGTLNIQKTASISDVALLNSSVVNMTGGTISDYLAAHDSTTVNISGGNLLGYAGGDGLYVENTSTTTISGTANIGGMSAQGDATVNITGGTVKNYYELNYSGNVTISGGIVTNAQFSYGTVASITGGLVSNATTDGGTTVNISGGEVGVLLASDTSIVNVLAGGTLDEIYLSGSAHLNGVAGTINHNTIYDESSSASATFYGQALTFSDATPGTDPNGVSGVYYNMDWTQADGTVDDVDFFQAGGNANNPTPSGVTFLSSSDAAPEPGTFGLIVPALGVLAIGVVRRRRS